MYQPHAWVQTASGRAFDLMAPTAAMVDLHGDVSDALSRIARFNGHIASGPYSVAQHCVIGADALAKSHGDISAAYFLLHDAHEAFTGDIATPVQRALQAHGRMLDGGTAAIKTAMARLKEHIDCAIWQAAGLPAPPDNMRTLIREMDLRMLATERRHLMLRPPMAWAPEVEAATPLRIVGKFGVWPWPKAADEYRIRLRRYLPPAIAALSPKPAPRMGRAMELA